MAKKIKLNFQIVLIGIFAVFMVIAIIMFAATGGRSGASGLAGTVTIWGTLPTEIVNQQIGGYINEFGDDLNIRYVLKNEATFDDELLQALAAGTGPDLFFLPQDKILEHQDKILTVPYENFPERTFRNQYIDEAGLFLTPSGVIAFPFMVDPMVMYYNRDLLSASFLVEPPEYWDELLTFTPQVSVQTESGQLIQSAVALGTFDNIAHAKDIFTLIMMQSGNPIVGRNSRGELVSALNVPINNVQVAESALRFYTDFADPAKETYSWNTAQRNSRDAFISGQLAVYFGYASELQDLRRANPNLNFDVTLMPQTRGMSTKMTIGQLHGLAISRASQNVLAAFNVANTFSMPAYTENLSNLTLLPPIRRESYATRPADPFFALFYDSGVIARGWLDPDPEMTSAIFRNLIRNQNSGSLDLFDNIRQADAAINEILRP